MFERNRIFVGWRREIEPPCGREIIGRFAGNISENYFLKKLFPAKPNYFLRSNENPLQLPRGGRAQERKKTGLPPLGGIRGGSFPAKPCYFLRSNWKIMTVGWLCGTGRERRGAELSDGGMNVAKCEEWEGVFAKNV